MIEYYEGFESGAAPKPTLAAAALPLPFDDLGLVAVCQVHLVGGGLVRLEDVSADRNGLWGTVPGLGRSFMPFTSAAVITVHEWRQPDPSDGLF